MVDQPGVGIYPEYWEADVVLRDGGTAHLRPIRPQDADALQAFHAGQSQASIYMRFFSFKPKLSGKEVRRFTEVDHINRVAFVITIGGEIMGIGRYDRLDDPTEAEVAFNISDAHQGRGIGSILLEHLAVAARENGIRRFTAEVLPDNRKMLMVFADAGYDLKRQFDDGVVSVEFNIDPTEKSRAVMESREHRAEARSVRDLLWPSSVAVIGASRKWGTVGYQLLEHIIEGGFKGPVYAVNPEAFELAGMVSFGKLSEIPGPVQLAIIAVPYEEVPKVVDDCAAVGVKGIVVATAGFADDGERGLVRQHELVRGARANGMRVIGPESLGILNTHPEVSLNASMAPTMPPRGSLGLFSQSAAVGVAVYAAASRRRLGLSSFLSAGNRADVSGNDAMQYWEDDADTSAVGLYLESIGNPRKFSRLARRLSRSKPVIVAKSDVTGLSLPPGHEVRTTQAPSAAVDAMMRQAGVIRVETIEQLMDIAQIASSQALPKGPGVAVYSNSVALAKVVADSAGPFGLDVNRLVTDLDLDAGMSLALPALKASLRESLADDSVHAVVAALLPARGLTVESLAGVLAECAAEAGKPVVAAFTGILDPSVHVEGMVGAEGKPVLPCYSNAGAAVAALGAIVRYAQWRDRDQGLFVEPEGCDVDGTRDRLSAMLAGVTGEKIRKLDAGAAAALLSGYGIDAVPTLGFGTADEAVQAAETVGWPVVLKTTDPALRHRLDLGGVRLDIQDAESLRQNVAQMRRALEPYGSPSLEVQAMAPVGQACTFRAMEDPLLGPVVSFGLAGDAVNLLDDWAHRVPPLSAADLHDVIRSPRASRKLFGYQGLPAVDVQALEDIAARLAKLKDDHPGIALVEFNPVLAGPSGATILGADVWIGNAAQRTDSARRAMRG
ncbi:bifunctional GNAT family N-acetyltransferase/acetate--CoA ligase family protein [Paenarthrobacter aurescens]|uniref:GNAT family N-acetyltransferase n=1 Tax=Paenarthrobacter aurescens TaxID=43663 RepID=A0A4Y3NAF0_PAEAU|nr:bifunctional GNAT family N-acetyltransferase/acetate--CoA ligase family protein [Paenarthrobacter aurescens]MDO6143284.1 GNAT family N-acetyltransferase [Paenarthrobacter aurescens]MDO6147132.1 GNAT family N-acetyltransferase [Paenarthrobacter aurescens]MDO6158376.1 GNAT family N-acetyltransferase [Paenarthrobacter aurescens]MDO6162360.1 GNAT family N-acetyltransferase [Paenarthrobacter aurescens]GEB18097.1 GNAT family N-acetyltransferase [Paenarthrobacter aurescens]